MAYCVILKTTRCSEKASPNQEALLTDGRKAASAKKLTTPYPHKYKTVMCRFWTKGQKCPFGAECNYAHGSNQLNEKTTAGANGDSKPKHSDTIKTQQKAESHAQKSHGQEQQDLIDKLDAVEEKK